MNDGIETDFLKDLPLELRSKIFSYLTFDDIKRCLFVSHYFYHTYKYPPSVPAVSFSVPRFDNDYYRLVQMIFYLNIIADGPKRAINKIEFLDYSPNFRIVSDLLSKYYINELRLTSHSNHVLTSIELFGPFNSLEKLEFGFATPFDFNRLQVLADLTPNLKCLTITHYPCLSQRYYTGERKFRNLLSLTISTSVVTIPQGDCSPEFLLSKFLSQTPNLTNLTILGNFFDKSFDPSNSFIHLLPNLRFLAIEIECLGSDSHYLPAANLRSRVLNELYIKVRSHEGHLESPRINLPENLETFCFDSHYIKLFKFFEIGDNLKRLFLNCETTVHSFDDLTNICTKCPNLEELFFRYLHASFSWLITIGETICLRLRKVNVETIDIESCDDNNKLLKVGNLRDIYVCQMPFEKDIEWLNSNGFNVYNGSDLWESLDDGIIQELFIY